MKTHRGGTYICMEGPAFSTKAESNVYRQWGMDVIGMTNLQEAKLAREAEIAYATLALVTDYDCWHEGHDDVTVDMVIEYLNKNVRNAQLILKDAVKRVAAKETPNQYRDAVKNAIFTRPIYGPRRRSRSLRRLLGNMHRIVAYYDFSLFAMSPFIEFGIDKNLAEIPCREPLGTIILRSARICRRDARVPTSSPGRRKACQFIWRLLGSVVLTVGFRGFMTRGANMRGRALSNHQRPASR